MTQREREAVALLGRLVEYLDGRECDHATMKHTRQWCMEQEVTFSYEEREFPTIGGFYCPSAGCDCEVGLNAYKDWTERGESWVDVMCEDDRLRSEASTGGIETLEGEGEESP